MEKEEIETKSTSQMESQEKKEESEEVKSTVQAEKIETEDSEAKSIAQMESQEEKKDETDAKSTLQAEKNETEDSEAKSIAQMEKQEKQHTELEESTQVEKQDTDVKSTQLEKQDPTITTESKEAGIESAAGKDDKVPERRPKIVRIQISPTTENPIPYNPTSEGGAAAVIEVTGSEEPSEAVKRVETDKLVSPSTLRIAGFKGAKVESKTFEFLGENKPLHMRRLEVQTFERSQNKRYLSQLKNHTYKILIVGDAGTGKTSIMRRFASGRYDGNYQVTIGVDYYLKVLYWDDCTTVRLELWDIAGSERAIPLTRAYYREAYGAFVVCDITKYSTLDSSVLWKKDIDSKVLLPNGSPIPCVLLFNKYDRRESTVHELLKEEQKLDRFIETNGFYKWFFTSAKEDINVQEAFMALIEKMMLNEKEVGKIKRSPDIVRPGTQQGHCHTSKSCC